MSHALQRFSNFGFQNPDQPTAADHDPVQTNPLQLLNTPEIPKARDIQIPRLLSDILAPTAGFLVSATDTDLQRRQRRRLGKRALRTLQIGGPQAGSPVRPTANPGATIV